jgi:hypothetical protein
MIRWVQERRIIDQANTGMLVSDEHLPTQIRLAGVWFFDLAGYMDRRAWLGACASSPSLKRAQTSFEHRLKGIRKLQSVLEKWDLLIYLIPT